MLETAFNTRPTAMKKKQKHIPAHVLKGEIPFTSAHKLTKGSFEYPAALQYLQATVRAVRS